MKPRGHTPVPGRPAEPLATPERRARHTPAPRKPADEHLFAAALESHPLPTLIVDEKLRVVSANGLARRVLGAHEGVPLGDALGCVDACKPAGCGNGERCTDCTFRRTALRAIAGETVRDRGFVMRGDTPEHDFHLMARAGPFHDGRERGRLAILALDDVNDILRDPGFVGICEGCGRVRDDEGGWHPLHRFLADRLGIEMAGPLCDECAGHGRRSR